MKWILVSSFLMLICFCASQNIFAQKENYKPNKLRQPKALTLLDSPLKIVVSDTLKKKEPDSDHDGVPDSADKCPEEKGVIQYDGCPMPDSDNDGIADDLDECPDEPGPIQYKGCPVTDRDGDKINDNIDKCPDVPGMARFDGCPTRDTDGDGVNDDDDKCVDEPGPATNFGCPDTRANRKLLKKQEGKKKSATPAGKI